MDSHDLMKLLIPEGNVKAVSEFTGLTTSLLYMERRQAGKKLTDTGTRNTIDRLDLFCEFNLDRNPDVVRMVAQRYTLMYRHHVAPVQGEVTVNVLLAQLGLLSKECGEAVNALASRKSLKECQVEVAQTKRALETALEMVSLMEDQ